ncbi:arsenite methyltransferase [Myxococcota bacterium]
MKEADDVRDDVSKAYSKAVNTNTGCCGGEATQKGVAARMAGYSKEDLADLPLDAVESSFGCGNPVAFAEVRAGEVVLDLGSGAGIDLLLAAQKVGPSGRVIGVDMTDDMIDRARANIEAANLENVEVRKGIIEQLPVEDSSVDWVISNCVINLSPEKDLVFAEIARVLKPGGRMLVSDIVVEDLPDWIRQSAALYAACIAGAISEDEYLAGLRRAGLIDTEVRERFVYDTAQLAGLIGSEISDVIGQSSCCAPPQPAEQSACCAPQPAAQSPCCAPPQPAEQSGCCGGLPTDLVNRAATDVQGKIWSAKVSARKPA